MKNKIGININTCSYTQLLDLKNISDYFKNFNFYIKEITSNYIICSKWELSIKFWKNGDFTLYLENNYEEFLKYSFIIEKIKEIISIFKKIQNKIDYYNFLVFHFFNFENPSITRYEENALELCSNIMSNPKIMVISDSNKFKAIKIQSTSLFC